MSFSFNVPATPVAEFSEAATKAARDCVALSNPAEHTKESIDAAVAAACALAAAGVLGSATVTATISGHANPDHKPLAGWANDCITVGLYSTEALPAAPDAA
jgi:hypothetical protein